MLDKKYRSTVAVVLVFFALLAFVYFFEKDKESRVDQDANTVLEENIDVVSFPVEDVNRVEIKNQTETFSFEKREGVWVLLSDESLEVNELQITTLLNDMNALQATQTIPFENAADFLLNDPITYLEAQTVTDELYRLSYGDTTLGGYEYYARINDNNDAFVVNAVLYQKLSTLTKDSFRKEVESSVESEVGQ
jgi:hypothetical protein